MISRLKNLIVEIHHRSLFQVVGIFLVGGWVAFEAVQTLTEGLGLPDWFPALALVLLIVFFPIVLATAFVHEDVHPPSPRLAAEPSSLAPLFPGEDPPPAPTGPKAEVPGVAPPPARKRIQWRRLALGGLAGILVLGGSGAGYAGLRYAGIGPFGTLVTAGAWKARDRVVLAEFEDQAGDSLAAYGATEWFRVALAQSAVISLASGDHLRNVLQRMGLDPEARVICERAREVALREGFKGAVCGAVIAVGSNFVVSAELLLAATGESLWSDQERAEDREAIIEAVERLSKRFRERVGESLGTLMASEQLPRVTTSSLEALRQFDLGIRALRNGQNSRGKPFLREAIALDTTFAYAYRALGMAYRNLDQTDSAELMLTKAYELRQHAALGERFRIEGDYHSNVTLDYEAAIQALERAIEAGDSTSAGNLSLLVRTVDRDNERAERLLSIALQQTDSGATWLSSMAQTLASQGRYGEAMPWAHRAVEKGGEAFDYLSLYVQASSGDYDGAEAALTGFCDRHSRDPGRMALCSEYSGYVALLRGHVSAAREHLDDAVRARAEEGAAGSALGLALARALIPVWFGLDTAAARAGVEDALQRRPLEPLPETQRPFGSLIQIHARVGQPQAARRYIEAWEATVTKEDRWIRESRHRFLGDLALGQGRPAEAVSEYNDADRLDSCPICTLPALAEAYDRANLADSALAVYERYLSTPYYNRLPTDAWYLPLAHERLWQLHEDRGNRADALRHARVFVELWMDADPELQPRVRAARDALRRLGG